MFCWPLKPVGSGRGEHAEMSATGSEWLICSALFVVLTSRPAPTAHGERYLEEKTVMMEVRVVCASVDERSNSQLAAGKGAIFCSLASICACVDHERPSPPSLRATNLCCRWGRCTTPASLGSRWHPPGCKPGSRPPRPRPAAGCRSNRAGWRS